VSVDAWAEVVTYSDRASAEALIGLLAQSGIVARISSDEAVPGLGLFFSVVVPAEFLHRARWLLSETQVSEPELTYLATHELPEGPDQP
jgi:hypothetical protein